MTAMKTIHLYGIPNCDTVKKARTWLADQAVETVFHDFKKEGVPANLLPGWLKAVGRDKLINRAGPTWRKLDAAIQASVVDDASASAVMTSHSSVIKRPVVVWADGTVTVGFKPELFAERLP
ncbi:arsenate reductase [Rhodoferax sp. GW822-FHT02A01]|uniref:arsenate reductase n=1 Tax=Rhodoferax sp. GW822-FHT02A01 TaxID=3141537 RepID=UPI00315D0080